MPIYTVYEKPNPQVDRIDRGADLEFVADRFDWGAALLGPLWLIGHRLWGPLLVYAGMVLALAAILGLLGASPQALALLPLAASIILGYEAGALRSRALEDRGWAHQGLITGQTYRDCERRFFDAWLTRQPLLTRSRRDAPPPPLKAQPAGGAAPSPGSRWQWLTGG